MTLEIPVDSIAVPRERQKRFDKNDERIQMFLDGLHKVGLINAIDVRKVADHYELICGRKRFWAARQLGWKHIMARVGEWTDEQIGFLILAENLHRDHMKPSEEARAVQKILVEFEKAFGPQRGRVAGGQARASSASRDPRTQSFVADSVVAPRSDGQDDQDRATEAASFAGSGSNPKPPKSPAQILADSLGVSERQAYDKKKIAERLTEDQLRHLDFREATQAELLALANVDDPLLRERAVELTIAGLSSEEAINQATADTAKSKEINERIRVANLSDEDWLATYANERGVRERLQDHTVFDREALLYRRTNDARMDHRTKSKGEVLKARNAGYGPYSNLLFRTLWVEHPGRWLLCGECGGRNSDMPECPDCYGCGFKLTFDLQPRKK
jgi:hypothetical protein